MDPRGVTHLKIRDIGPTSQSFFVVGIIIKKQELRVIKTKKDQNERGVWSFTIRDTPYDTINVTAWGSVEHISQLFSSFQLGDVVDLVNTKSIFRRVGDYEDKYQPSVSSMFQLSYNEEQSKMLAHDVIDSRRYFSLMHIPMKSVADISTLNEVHSRATALRDNSVNLLAVVRDVGLKRNTISKFGKGIECCDVALMDQTPAMLILKIWDSQTISRAAMWIPMKTVLFLSDARVQWNSFKSTMTATVTGRTIITEDPNLKEAEFLRVAAMKSPMENMDIADTTIATTDLSSINIVMSCKSILNKTMGPEVVDEFTGLVYGVLQFFDIDGCLDVVLKKCGRCNMKVGYTGTCVYEQCPVAKGMERQCVKTSYDIRVSIADHTASITNCRLTNSVSQQLLGYLASEFMDLPIELKTELKWKYLFKHVAARLIVQTNSNSKAPLITVVSLDRIAISEYSSRIPMC